MKFSSCPPISRDNEAGIKGEARKKLEESSQNEKNERKESRKKLHVGIITSGIEDTKQSYLRRLKSGPQRKSFRAKIPERKQIALLLVFEESSAFCNHKLEHEFRSGGGVGKENLLKSKRKTFKKAKENLSSIRRMLLPWCISQQIVLKFSSLP